MKLPGGKIPVRKILTLETTIAKTEREELGGRFKNNKEVNVARAK